MPTFLPLQEHTLVRPTPRLIKTLLTARLRPVPRGQNRGNPLHFGRSFDADSGCGRREVRMMAGEKDRSAGLRSEFWANECAAAG